jgi:hypothetical protein
MNLIWPAYLVFLALLGSLFWGPNVILYACVLGATFSATSAINITSATDLSSGISFSWILMAILVANYFFGIFSSRGGRARFPQNNSIQKYIVMYWIVVCIGLFNLAFMDHSSFDGVEDIMIQNPGFTASNLVRFFYLTLGLAFICFFSMRATSEQVKNVLTLYVSGVVAVCFIGLVGHFLLPDTMSAIFNTSISRYAQGFTAEGKISGPAVEPSLFVQCIGIGLAIQLAKMLMGGRGLILRIIDIILFFLMMMAMMFSGAHTSLIVLVALIVEVIILSRLTLAKIVILGILSISAAPFLFSIYEKLQTFSGLERTHSIEAAFGLFLEKPILGFGFSEVTSHDLIFNSLANTGLIATVILLLIFCKLLNFSHYSKCQSEDKFIFYATYAAVLNLFITNLFTGLAHPFIHFYIVMAVSVWVYSRFDRGGKNSLIQNRSVKKT